MSEQKDIAGGYPYFVIERGHECLGARSAPIGIIIEGVGADIEDEAVIRVPRRRARYERPRGKLARAAFDIEGDDVLHARYLTRIPVVAIDGEELFDYTIDEEALIRRILYREGR